jgi:hypothetical protein
MDLSPSRTGLLAQTLWRSPGSRAHCVLTCMDSSTTPSPAATRDLTRLADVAFPLTEKGRHPVACFRSSMIPPASPLSTLRYDPSRDHRQDSRPEWSRFSFSVGLLHPLQCAGLSRRSLSPSHFARAFRCSFGMPAHRYLVGQRVDVAKTLLLHTNQTGLEIALKSGFQDQATFSRAFRRVVGTSASDWKRQRRSASVSVYWSAPTNQDN